MWRALFKTQQLLSCLLCVFILISSVDSIPDPPSIKPHYDAAISFKTGGHHLPMVNQDCVSDVASFHPFAQVRFFRLSLLSDDNLLLPAASHLHQASDSSPPNSAS
jgi:hypothetical protein